MTAMQEAAITIANTARTAMELGGFSVEVGIDHAVDTMLSMARDADKRAGSFAGTLTLEQAEQWRFMGSVAADVRDNTPRPSTGPMRDYVRAVLR